MPGKAFTITHTAFAQCCGRRVDILSKSHDLSELKTKDRKERKKSYTEHHRCLV